MANAVRFSYTGKPRKMNLFFWVFISIFLFWIFKAFLYSSNAAAAPSLRFSSKKEQAASFQRCARPFRFPMTKSNIPPCFPALRRFPHRSNFHPSNPSSKRGKQSPCISALRSSPTRAFRPRCPKQPLVFRRYARPSNFHQANFPSKEGGYSPPF